MNRLKTHGVHLGDDQSNVKSQRKAGGVTFLEAFLDAFGLLLEENVEFYGKMVHLQFKRNDYEHWLLPKLLMCPAYGEYFRIENAAARSRYFSLVSQQN